MGWTARFSLPMALGGSSSIAANRSDFCRFSVFEMISYN
jgi:hypothetical protein